MPTMYIKPRAQAGEVLRDLATLATNAADKAQLKAKVMRGGSHDGEIMVYARTGVKEKLKDFFFMSQDTRRAAGRRVLIELAQKVGTIEGLTFDAQVICRQADPRSSFGAPLTLPQGPGETIADCTADNRSSIKVYAPALRSAWKMYQARFEWVFFDNQEYAEDFVFQSDKDLAILHDALIGSGCPEEDVVEVTDAMRAFVKQSADAYQDIKPHRRLPVQLENGDLLPPADYLKVERFAQYWHQLGKSVAEEDPRPINDLQRLDWYHAMHYFVVKHFAPVHRAPMRIGEAPPLDPEKLLSLPVPSHPKYDYLYMQARALTAVGNHEDISPADALEKAVWAMTDAMQREPVEHQQAFTASLGREFKGRMAAILHRKIGMQDPIGLFKKRALMQPNITYVKRMMGTEHTVVLDLEKQTQLERLVYTQKFIDAVYSNTAKRLSPHFENTWDLRVGQTLYKKQKDLGLEDGFRVMQYAAMRQTGRSRRKHPSDRSEDQMVVRIPAQVPDGTTIAAMEPIIQDSLMRAVQISRKARASGMLRAMAESRSQDATASATEGQANNKLDEYTRLGPFVYLARGTHPDFPVLYQRKDTYVAKRLKPFRQP